jgi:predicted esterase
VEIQATFSYNARYSKLGTITSQTKEVWFVLHGYGQLAPYFIRKFHLLNKIGHCVIAPEGLNRFYKHGFSGRVGASWMTKEDRIRDIENYISYLNSVYSLEIPVEPTFQINLLGFSQGAATASRWITQSLCHFDTLILWAGIFPPDLNLEVSKLRLKKPKVSLIYGSKDPFISDEVLKEQYSLAAKLQVAPVIHTFDGAHDIDSSVLEKIVGL